MKMMEREYPRSAAKLVRRAVYWAVPGLLALVAGCGSCGTVGYGERGVHMRFRAITGKVFGEGLYFKLPFIETVEVLNVKVQKNETNASASTKDLQIVHSLIALNWHLRPAAAATFFQQYGAAFKENVLDPGLQEVFKAVTARYTAEEVIQKRETVTSETNVLLRERFEAHGIVVDGLNTVNFEFSKSFNDAIEAKVTAEQHALAEKNRLEQIKFQAQQAVEASKGKAQAIQIESQALLNNPQVLQLRALEKWNGQLPQFLGSGAIPFIREIK